MNGDFFYGMNEWVILFAFMALMLAASEAGLRFGFNAQPTVTEKTKSKISVVEDAVLGVLGLLLAFTMSMAVTRFEVRKQIVLDEANAIGTSLLRAQLLPHPEGPEIASLLRNYVDVRVRFADAGADVEQVKAARANALRLQNEFWTRAVAYGQKDPNPVKAGLLLQSLNQAIDLESARWMAIQNHVPQTVILVNALVAVLAATMVGYAFGLEGRRQVFSTFLLIIAITVLLAVIVDLDRPRKGLIRVGQQPMTDLQGQLRAPGS
ncbi:MAG: hypothetical protein ABSD20_03435 [Terriglobales bacterium]|jgi:hypothetical protein